LSASLGIAGSYFRGRDAVKEKLVNKDEGGKMKVDGESLKRLEPFHQKSDSKDMVRRFFRGAMKETLMRSSSSKRWHT